MSDSEPPEGPPEPSRPGPPRLSRPALPKSSRPPARARQEESLVLAELVSRVLDRGVVVAGEVMISVAGIDLVYLGLQLHVTSIETAATHAEKRRALGTQTPEP